MITRQSISPWFRFRLRTLFVVMTLFCILLAVLAQPMIEVRRQEQLLTDAQKLGATVSCYGFRQRPPSLRRTLLGMLDSKYSSWRLNGLDFTGTKITDEDLKLLPEIKFVERLNLSGTAITDTSLKTLSKLPHLYRLNLNGTKVTDEGIVYLESTKELASLQVVSTAVTYEALQDLDAKLPWAHFAEQRATAEVSAFGGQVPSYTRHIETDYLQYGRSIVEAGEQVSEVILGMNKRLSITQSDVTHLSYLKELKHLILHSVSLSQDGFSTLQELPKLEELEIWMVNITDRDLEHLTRQTQLQRITLYGCNEITDSGVSKLSKIKSLKDLSVRGCEQITKSIADLFLKDLPECQVEYSLY